jgi:hypothetical protein
MFGIVRAFRIVIDEAAIGQQRNKLRFALGK